AIVTAAIDFFIRPPIYQAVSLVRIDRIAAHCPKVVQSAAELFAALQCKAGLTLTKSQASSTKQRYSREDVLSETSSTLEQLDASREGGAIKHAPFRQSLTPQPVNWEITPGSDLIQFRALAETRDAATETLMK